MKNYSVGIYARLSVDGGEKKNESIKAQLEIAKAFIKNHENMTIFDCYTDIGKSGTDFKRDGFERMMNDIKQKKINCIVVKDLSRFARNHIEMGNYIEKIFPFMGVRFIAVTDNYDSNKITWQSDMLSVELKNLVNEMYARDISIKIKSAKNVKWEQGGFTGGFAPYGYLVKNIGERRCLFVEKETAFVVKKIYEQFLAGKKLKEISKWLYNEKINTPSEYHKNGQLYCFDKEKLKAWSVGSLKMILTNPVYIGCLVQKRAVKYEIIIKSAEDMQKEKPVVKKNTHEAIISEEIFFRVVSAINKN